MIITRTPFRISFFGGGTDYPNWIREHGGTILGTSINHYCYLNCRYLPPFFEHRYRICYTKTESVETIQKIQHPAVRAILQHLEFHNTGLEIFHSADLPARAGLGSSSSFVVGLLYALYELRQLNVSKKELANLAIYVEQILLEETVGSQDQILATHGGLNQVTFLQNGSYQVNPIELPEKRLDTLQDHLLLFFTGKSRFASEIAKSKVANFKEKTHILLKMQKMVFEALAILENPQRNLFEIGELLDESWHLKRTLSEKVSSIEIDSIYNQAKAKGAIGGKLLGAGGGGFMLFFARPQDHFKIKMALSHLIHVPFRFESEGCVSFQKNYAKNKSVLTAYA